MNLIKAYRKRKFQRIRKKNRKNLSDGIWQYTHNPCSSTSLKSKKEIGYEIYDLFKVILEELKITSDKLEDKVISLGFACINLLRDLGAVDCELARTHTNEIRENAIKRRIAIIKTLKDVCTQLKTIIKNEKYFELLDGKTISLRQSVENSLEDLGLDIRTIKQVKKVLDLLDQI